jgi:hypothetical protein
MALVGISLNAVTAVGAGTAIMFDTPKSDASIQVQTTGSPTDVEINIEGTLDGVHFDRLGVWATGGGGPGNIIGSTGKPVLGVRANLTTLTGGTSPTVTATVAAA